MQKNVYLTSKKAALEDREAQVAQLTNSSAPGFLDTSITKLIACAKHEVIGRIELINHETGKKIYLSIDEVIINHGYECDTNLLKIATWILL